MEIILASASPRRQELLRQVGVPFQVHPSNVDEVVADPLPPGQLVERLAVMKARAVAKQYPDSLVLGADTIVVVDGQVLNKPSDRAEAIGMLRLLSGREHQVMTGVALIHQGRELVSHEETSVRFLALTQAQMERYADSGEPMDKAGGYGIQGRAAALIEGINGDYFNVVGLPICRTVQMLAQFGVQVL